MENVNSCFVIFSNHNMHVVADFHAIGFYPLLIGFIRCKFYVCLSILRDNSSLILCDGEVRDVFDVRHPFVQYARSI